MNGLLYILEELKKNFDGKFIITKDVKTEVLDRPIKIQRFELEALRIQRLIDNKVLELPSSLNINESDLNKKTFDLMKSANNLLENKKKKIKIVSEAEISCLALSEILNKKNIENIIAIDERTTRLLSEAPQELEKIISRKMHFRVHFSSKDFSKFEKFKFIRSPEIVYAAHKKDLLKIKDSRALEATIYATKFKGSSISWDEIKILKKL